MDMTGRWLTFWKPISEQGWNLPGKRQDTGEKVSFQKTNKKKPQEEEEEEEDEEEKYCLWIRWKILLVVKVSNKTMN